MRRKMNRSYFAILQKVLVAAFWIGFYVLLVLLQDGYLQEKVFAVAIVILILILLTATVILRKLASIGEKKGVDSSGASFTSSAEFGTESTKVNVPDTTSTYVPQDDELMLIEKAYAIGGVATVVSGTLFRTINDGDEVLVKTAEGSIYTSQVSGLKIWHGYINKPALCANKDDAVSFRLRKINNLHISARDKIFAIR